MAPPGFSHEMGSRGVEGRAQKGNSKKETVDNRLFAPGARNP